MAIGVKPKVKKKLKANIQVVKPIEYVSDMTVKQHVKRLNEFKKLLDKEDQDQNIEALRKNDDFMAEFNGLDEKWGGKVMQFLPRYNGVFEGREENLEALLDTVSDLNLPTNIVIGEAGMGKTTLVRHFLRLVNEGELTCKMGFELVGIEVSLVSAYKNGNNDFIGILGDIIPAVKELERKAQEELNKPNLRFVLFIDEIHGISKMVQLSDGESVGVDVIKPAIYPNIDGMIIVGATTSEEYDRYIFRNAPFTERFARKTTLQPFDKETLFKIDLGHWNYLRKVRGLKGGLDKKLVNYIINVLSEYDPQHAEPRKSKDFISMLESHSFNKGVEPDLKMVQYLFKRDKGFTPDKRLNVNKIMTTLRNGLFGQFMAKEMFEVGLRGRAGAMDGDRGKTLFSALLVGPTGVGKTEAGKLIAKAVYGEALEPIVVRVNVYASQSDGVNNMMKFIAKELTVNADRPIILDEIEKGFISKKRPEVKSPMADAMMTILGDGVIQWIDEYGSEQFKSIKQNLVFATTNAGFGVYSNKDSNSAKKRITKDTPKNKMRYQINALTQEIETVIKEEDGFTPELIGRFDSTICYEALTQLDAIGIVQRKLDAYSEFLGNKYQIEVGFGKTQQYKGTRIDGLEKGTTIKIIQGGKTEELETKEEETGVVETYPVTVALATVFADMTDSEKKGARQVHEVFRNNINRLGSELEDEEEGYIAGDKVEFYVQAIDRETGDDIDSEEAPELTKDVETLKEDFGKEAIRIALRKMAS